MIEHCVAIADQKTWRDLRRLEDAVPSVSWLDVEDAAGAPDLLVACGLWASREQSARALLKRRSQAGAATLLVARFEPADLGPVLGAPVAVELKPGEANAIAWDDGTRYEVPSVTFIHTALAEEHWARSIPGTTILAFRPHTQAGLIVVCTPTLVGPALGADVAQQQAVLLRLLEEVERRRPPRVAESGDASTTTPAATPREYLDRFGEEGALVLLARLLSEGRPVDSEALHKVGAALPRENLSLLVASLPSATPREVEDTLQDQGWGAHLRALTLRETEAP